MDRLAKINFIKRFQQTAHIMSHVTRKDFGLPQAHIQVLSYGDQTQISLADREVDPGTEYYYLIGPDDSVTRDFCKAMLKLDKVYSKDEIDQLISSAKLEQCLDTQYDYIPGPVQPSGGFGGSNCRHRLIRFRGKYISTPVPTNNQIANIARKSIFR